MKIYASFCELNISFCKTLTFRFADYKSFTEHKISERRIVTSDGIQHNRDTLAAFNIKNAIVNDTSTKKKKVTKSKEFFDIVRMKASYNEFCLMERYLLSV